MIVLHPSSSVDNFLAMLKADRIGAARDRGVCEECSLMPAPPNPQLGRQYCRYPKPEADRDGSCGVTPFTVVR
jgi:hypothetical protein